MMSNQISIARPYAKAFFQCALDAGRLAEWSTWLDALSQLTQQPEFVSLMSNPSVSRETLADMMVSLSAELSINPPIPEWDVALRLLAMNKRLTVLPAIREQFNLLCAKQEKTLMVHVTSFAPLTEVQSSRLVDVLSRKLERHVTLQQSVDATLLGGAVVRAHDLVIDGSVRGQLNKLAAELAA